MKLSFNKLGVCCSLLVLGGGAGFWVSRHLQTSPTIVETPQVYSGGIPRIVSPPIQQNSSENVNFIAQAVQKVGPAVVRIDASRELTSSLPEKFTQPFFRRFFWGRQFCCTS